MTEDKLIYREAPDGWSVAWSGDQGDGDVVIPSEHAERLVTEIGESAFRDLKIRSVAIPESVKRIGDFAFSGCRMERVTIPGSVTEIGAHAFENCTSLVVVDMPKELDFIGDCAFHNCPVKLLNGEKPIPAPEIVSGAAVYSDGAGKAAKSGKTEIYTTYAAKTVKAGDEEIETWKYSVRLISW